MDLQNDYQFVMIPQQLSSCLDANCGKMLTTLIGLSTIMSKEDGWFYRSNKELQLDTRFSQNLVIATLDTLYQAGIINVDCVGKGRGHRSNRIHINFESFKKYQQYSFNDIRNNPDLWIETVSYKNHYSPSYCKDTGKEIGNTLGKRIGKKVTTNTDTTDTSNSIDIINTKENNIYNIENIDNIYNIDNTKEDNIINNKEDMLVNVIEDNDIIYNDSERNIIMVIEEEKKECSDEELITIYLNSFGEFMNNYPGLNYSLLKTNNQDTFYDCYKDIVNELVMKIKNESGRKDIKEKYVLGTLNNYLDYIKYSYQ